MSEPTDAERLIREARARAGFHCPQNKDGDVFCCLLADALEAAIKERDALAENNAEIGLALDAEVSLKDDARAANSKLTEENRMRGVDLSRCRIAIDYLITEKLRLKEALGAAISAWRSGEPLHENGGCQNCELIFDAAKPTGANDDH